MSGASIAKKVNLGLRKAASKVGFSAKLYRPDNYNNVLDDRNFIKNLVVAWSVDDSFAKNPVDELDHFKIYVSNEDVQVGDMILAADQGKTFVIVETEPMRVPAGILVNERVTVYQTEYTPTADVKTQLVEKYVALPCAVKWNRASTSTSGLPVSSMKTGQSQVEVWTWVTPNSITLNDVLEIGGVKFNVQSCQSTSKGTKVIAVSTVAGK